MNRFTKTIMFALLLVVPARILAQDYPSGHAQAVVDSHDANRNQKVQLQDYENGFLFNVFQIANVEERVQLASALATSDMWLCNPTENPGELFIRPNSHYADIPIYAEFDYLRATLREEYEAASMLPKEEFAEIFNSWAQNISIDYYNFLISDYVGDRANHCMDAEPFCTSDVYNFPALNSGYSWSGPNYGCLNSSPTSHHSFWYYMRIGVAGNITIKIEASFDVDFALWGPFENQIDPCPTAAGQAGLLTANCTTCPNNTSNPNFYPSGNLHDCSYSVNSYEYAHIVNGVVGQYFILLITNYSGSSGNITFQKYAGNGETDCDIMPPLVSNDGPYCVGETIHLTANGQAGSSYSWTGPNNFTSNLQNPSIPNCTLSMGGTYTCTITVGNQTSSAPTEVIVNANPNANAGPDQTITYGSIAQLSGSGGAGTFNFHWEPANMVVNPNAQNTQTVVLTQTQTFTLTVTNPQGGCTSSDQMTVHISGSSMTLTANASPDHICQGESSQLQANAGGGSGTFSYAWTPTTGLSNPNIYNPIATPSQTTTYTCHVTDVPANYSQDVSVTVNVHSPSSSEETAYICPGETYNFHGNYCSDEGDYEYHTQTLYGCDSTIVLHLHHYPTYDETTVNESICFGESYNFFGTEYSESGQYEHTLQTIHGCDSIVRLNLTIWPDNGVTTNEVTVCPEQLPYTFYGVDYYDAIDKTEWDTDIHGCDSAVRLVLTISDYYIPEVERHYTCEPSFTWAVNGMTYYEDIFVTDTLPTASCDGIFRLDLHFQQVPEVEHIYDTACDSYYWPVSGATYTQTGTYFKSLPMYYDPDDPSTLFPCTRDYELHLTVNYSDTDHEVSIDGHCDPFTFNWFGEDYLIERNGDYPFTKNGLTTHGCDSALLVKVTNMKYTPKPSIIQCSDNSVIHSPTWDTVYVVTNTEFFSFNYDFFVNETGSSEWDECEWAISKPSWLLEVLDSNSRESSCKVYVADRDENPVVLTATARNGCDEVTRTIYLKSSFLDIEEHQGAAADVSIVPNPNSGQMRLNFENMEGRVNVKVFDMRGNPIDSFETDLGSSRCGFDYDMKRHAEGIYFFVISNNAFSLTRKAVIIH